MADYKLTACAIEDYIYDSVDRGVTWIPESGSFVNQWTCIAASSDGKKLIAAAFFITSYDYGEVYRSVDSGATWTKIVIDIEPHVWFSVASSSDGNILYAGDVFSPSSGLYRSLDGGQTWERKYSGNYLWTAIACSVDGKIVAASGIEGLVISIDSGETWIPIIVEGTPVWYWVDCSTDGRFIVAADYSDNGYIWTIRITEHTGIQVKKQLNSGGIGWLSVACSGNGSTIVASTIVAGSADLYISYNYGEDWIKKWSEPSLESWYPVACSKDGMCLAGGIIRGPIITSFDGGITWNRQTSKQWTRIIVATESEVCVLGKTKILMADGSMKPIKDIVRGERVITDKETGATKKVARVLVSVSKGTAVCLPKGTLGNTEDVICTEAHPVWALDGTYRMKSKDVNGAVQIENWDTFYNIQYEEEGTYYAEGIRMDSVSPYYYKKRLPKKLYFNQAKHDKRVIVKDENDKRRGKPKII